MKLSMITFTIDLQNKPVFTIISDSGKGWRTIVVYLGIFVFELFLDGEVK